MLPDGYPPLETYTAVPSLRLFREMREFARSFLDANADVLKSYAARWSEDPLHRWSRRWEYLYVTERVGEAARRDGTTRVLDAGSGLTFFPHWLTYKHPVVAVACPDRDPQIEPASADLRPPAQENVTYATQDLADLRYPDASFSLVSCVSVLEHTWDRDVIIREFARVLEPGGVLALTFDVSVDGRWEIPRSEAAQLLEDLEARFTPDGDYAARLEDFDPDAMLTTAWAREHDATLLPWKYPNPVDMLRRFPNVFEMFKPRFKLLTCFCGTWRKA